MTTNTKYCCRCNSWKENSNFHVNNRGILHSYCNPCRTKYNKETHRNHYDNPVKRAAKMQKQRELRAKGGRTRIRNIFNSNKGGAIRRGIHYDLTIDLLEAFFIIQDWKCAVTNIPFDFSTMQGMRPFGPAIDRKDSSRGYTADNIQIVCNIYNYGKNKFTHQDVVDFAIALLKKENII